MMKALLSLALVLASTGIAAADDKATDLNKLVGTWVTVSQIEDGKDMPAEVIKDSTVVIDAAGKWEALKAGTSFLKGSVKLDPSKSPKAADWSIDGSDMMALGICSVDGDTWKHCFSFTKRPTEFGSKEGSGVIYIVLKRVKK